MSHLREKLKQFNCVNIPLKSKQKKKRKKVIRSYSLILLPSLAHVLPSVVPGVNPHVLPLHEAQYASSRRTRPGHRA